MDDKLVKELISVLRVAIKNKDWDKVKYVEGCFSMHTINIMRKLEDYTTKELQDKLKHMFTVTSITNIIKEIRRREK